MIRPLQVLAPLPLAAALLFTAGAAVAQSFAGSVLRDAGTAAETVLSSQGPQAAAADWILTARGGGTAYDGSISVSVRRTHLDDGCAELTLQPSASSDAAGAR